LQAEDTENVQLLVRQNLITSYTLDNQSLDYFVDFWAFYGSAWKRGFNVASANHPKGCLKIQGFPPSGGMAFTVILKDGLFPSPGHPYNQPSPSTDLPSGG
jgi:hypothetical protein